MSRYTLMDYFSIYVEEWDSLLEEFLRHLAMTSFSVVLALIIAVPLGIFITRNKAVSNVVIGIANVMQSIPCMALLAMGIPFLGVGETLAIFMVFVYAFLPILKNTYTALKQGLIYFFLLCVSDKSQYDNRHSEYCIQQKE